MVLLGVTESEFATPAARWDERTYGISASTSSVSRFENGGMPLNSQFLGLTPLATAARMSSSACRVNSSCGEHRAGAELEKQVGVGAGSDTDTYAFAPQLSRRHSDSVGEHRGSMPPIASPAVHVPAPETASLTTTQIVLLDVYLPFRSVRAASPSTSVVVAHLQ
jgi:hypothetical protein